MPERLPHLSLPEPKAVPFRYPGFVRDDRSLPTRDPAVHGGRLLADLAAVRQGIRDIQSVERPPEAQGHLVKASIVPDTPANVAGLGDKRSDNVVVAVTADGAIVHLRRDNLGKLERKIADYANPQKLTKKGARYNAPLVAPLEEIRLATLHDLSAGWLSEDALDDGETYWVELWVAGGRLAADEDHAARRAQLRWLMESEGAHALPEPRAFVATEHDIFLARLTGAMLRRLPAVMPEVYRVVPPLKAQVPWLISEQATQPLPPVEPAPDPETVVALLDTGVAEAHPLLEPSVYTAGVTVVVGGLDAGDRHGHGTRMAGVVAYRDLAGELATGGRVQARTYIQSVKVMEGGSTPADDLEFWPGRTEDAVLAAESTGRVRRVFNLPIGARPERPGDRTAWDLAVDTLAHGDGSGRLVTVSAGNVEPSQGRPPAYPDDNLAVGLCSPGHALNAITVGAITDLIVCSPGRSPVAAEGQLSPFSRADVGGARAIKPDVVLEGGNWSTDGQSSSSERSLSILTTDRGYAIGPPLSTTNATSAACSGVSGLLSEIWQANTARRPETIRGLLIHSARWTSAMRQQFVDRRDRLRAFGYGTPRGEFAGHSDRPRPTVIVEAEIHPERKLGDGREMHFVPLPMPDAQLAALAAHEVELSVTLSWFTEPNESSVRAYVAAGLRWDIQGPHETVERFRERINYLERGDDYPGGGDALPWEIGTQARRRGTVQSDRCRVTAEELRGSRAIGVWTTGGWWREREGYEDAAIAYALIITLDAGDTDVDLYTAVDSEIEAMIEAEVDVDVEIDIDVDQ